MPICPKTSRGLITPEEFLILSAEISYQLTPRKPNFLALTHLILGPAVIPETTPITDAIECLHIAYGRRLRKLGPLQLIHPLRTTAILARSMLEPTTLDILGALFHDKEEDLTQEKLTESEWTKFTYKFNALLEKIDHNHQWYLGERISLLCRHPGASYNEYIGHILDHSVEMPDLLHVKLADRLDNTFDTHLQNSGVNQLNFYRSLFDILFVPSYKGVQVNDFHFLPGENDSVLLLSQLFKNIIFLSLSRSERRDRIDKTTTLLFDAVAIAGIREAQWILLELFASCITDLKDQWQIVAETLEYTHHGGAQQITPKAGGNILDGIVTEYFGNISDLERKVRLALLFQDKDKLARVILAFIVVFSSFLNDADFYLEGVERTGIRNMSEEG